MSIEAVELGVDRSLEVAALLPAALRERPKVCALCTNVSRGALARLTHSLANAPVTCSAEGSAERLAVTAGRPPAAVGHGAASMPPALSFPTAV